MQNKSFRETIHQLRMSDTNDKNKLIYFDNAATCLIPDSVINSWKNFNLTCSGSPSRGTYNLSNNSKSKYENSRNTIKKFFKIGDKHELVFCQGTTDAINKAAFGLRDYVKPGDIILVSELEHNSNYLPWLRLAQETNAYLEIIPWRNNDLDYEFMQLLDGKRVRLIAITAVSNVTGYEPDFKIIREFAKKNNALVFIDAAQAAGHKRLNIDEMDPDLIAVSAHKMYGPKGIGGLIGKKDILAKLLPMTLGGGAVKSVEVEGFTFLGIPERHEAGTRDVATVCSWAEACCFLDEYKFDELIKKEKEISMYFRSKLDEIQGVNLISNNGREESSIISFVVDNIHSHDLSNMLNKKGIAIRTGHLCAHLFLKALGLRSINRISIGIYNTIDEVDYFIETLKDIISFTRGVLK